MPSTSRDHFSPLAAAYTRGRFGYPVELFDFLAGLCAAHHLAWDCATGSGQAVRPLAERFQQVIASDISSELLERAPRMPNVLYIKASAEDVPLLAGSVDLVTVAQALHWFDLEVFWGEVRRVLRPAGVFAFWGYNWPLVDPGIDAILNEFREEISADWPKQSALLHAGYGSVVPPFEAVAAPPMEVLALWTAADYVAHLASWSAVRYYRERKGMNPLPGLEEKLGRVWPSDEQRRVRWPLVLRVFRV